MPDSRDTSPDGAPRTDRPHDTDRSEMRPTPSVPTPEVAPPFEPVPPSLRSEELPQPLPEHEHEPVPAERRALVGLETTFRSEGPTKVSTTGGFTQRSLPEVERPTSSLRALDGRFGAIEHKLDQLEARLRLLEKQTERASRGPVQPWMFWALLALLVLAYAAFVGRR